MHKPMRILIIVDLAWDVRLGAVRVFMGLADAWRAAGHTVEKYSLTDAFPTPSRSRFASLFRQLVFPWKAAAAVRAGACAYLVKPCATPELLLTVEQAFQLKRNAFDAQIMFSNLGHLPFDSNFGPLKLETLWAPCALRGIEGEQTLGAVTINGSLHLTHTSPAPTAGLLGAIEEELRKACAV